MPGDLEVDYKRLPVRVLWMRWLRFGFGLSFLGLGDYDGHNCRRERVKAVVFCLELIVCSQHVSNSEVVNFQTFDCVMLLDTM